MPSVRDAGPEGGKVMLALMRRGYMNVLPVVALLTIISGFWLYWNLMETVGPIWAGSMSARIYGVGAVTSVIAFGLGVFIARPNALKLGAIMEAMAKTPDGPARAALAADMAAPRARMSAMAPWIAGLLAISTVCMAVGRYV
jgi:type VI protein secretion system component VasK